MLSEREGGREVLTSPENKVYEKTKEKSRVARKS